MTLEPVDGLLFTRALAGQPAPPPGAAVAAGPLVPPDGLLPDFRASAADLIAEFSQAGALDRIVTVPFGTVPGLAAIHLRVTELLVHGWDLARATGQDAAFPVDLAEAELAFSRAALGNIPAGRTRFAPPRPVDDGAPAIDRLAALLGRTVI